MKTVLPRYRALPNELTNLRHLFLLVTPAGFPRLKLLQRIAFALLFLRKDELLILSSFFVGTPAGFPDYCIRKTRFAR